MSTFTAAISDLGHVGPVLDLTVTVPESVEEALLAAGKPVPPPITVSMMIDTGASGSAIEPDVTAHLGLNPIDIVDLATPGNDVVTCEVFPLRLHMPGGAVASATAIGAQFKGQGIQGLIGRDLLRFGVLIYIGPENQFTLSF